MTTEHTISAALLVLGMAGSAFCSGVETGIYSLSRIRLSLRASGERAGVLARRLKAEVDRPARALATLLIANTIFNNLGSIGISALLEPHFSEVGTVVLNVLLLTPLLFIFSESLPKELFRTGADRLTYYAAPLLYAGRLVLTATLVLPLVELLVRGVTRALRLGDPSGLSEPGEKIAAMLKEGARHGVLSESQTTLLDRALLLRETRIRGEMIPWSQAEVVSAAWDRHRVAEFLATHRHSRYPVVDASGNVVGVVEHLDLCLAGSKGPGQLVRPAVFLDPEASVRDGLVRLRSADTKLGVVRQGGKPVGVVSTADLIEPLLGEADEAPRGRRQ
jgi:CBS domain containing-hemolysin-like protein